MRYIDSGNRDPQETLGAWLQCAVSEDVVHLRFQTGFYSFGGLSPIASCLASLASRDLPITALIGANEGATLLADAQELALRAGIPRAGARLGVVSFDDGFFHPKVYHVELASGAQLAYVGSANLTSDGLEKHVEAGILLSSDEDGASQLGRIADSIDRWFTTSPAGLTVISDLSDLDVLHASGVLATSRPPRVTRVVGVQGGVRVSRPRLGRLLGLNAIPRLISTLAGTAGGTSNVQLPTVSGTGLAPPSSAAAVATSTPAATPVPTTPTSRPVVNWPGFPQYLFFEPGAHAATEDWDALTGSLLPNGATGLIVKLNQDSGRHFLGRPGTSNMSLPVQTLSTLRFGVEGVHNGPTAKFGLDMRYISSTSVRLDAEPSRTSVKGYGFTQTESGHGDIRLVVTAKAKSLATLVANNGFAVPAIGDLVLLEWPVDSSPSFKVTFLEQASSISTAAEAIYVAAQQQGALVGGEACWLPPGVAPSW